LLESACDEPPAVVAHSLLGGLAAGFAARHHGRLERLCIYAAPAVGPYRMPLRLRAVAMRFALRTTRRNNERFERFALLDRDRTRQRDPAWFDSFSAYSLARARVPEVKRTMNQLVRAGTRRVSDAALGGIDAPVGLLWGRRDRMVPIGLAYGTRSRLGWPLCVVAKSAHAPHIERPQDFVACVEQILSPPVQPTLTPEAVQ
jgi:2-hydroxymuconate-semialdehyde hydrolase